MKSTKLLIIAALFVSGFESHAITNTAIAVSGTNIVLSWPSIGYEIYLVQYRHTLDPSDSWSNLTNAYPANSTNRTTFTIPGVVPAPSVSQGVGNSLLASMATDPQSSLPPVPMAIPKDGSSAGVPACLYPLGFDLSNFYILDPATGESVSGSEYSKARALDSSNPLFNGPQPMDGGSGGTDSPTPEPETGFYRVFHIPNFLADFSNYTFDGPTFIPIDYAAPDADVNYVDTTTVLIGGQPTDTAFFMPYAINGVTNWGVGIYFDQLPNGTNTIQLITTVRQSDTLDDQTSYLVFSNAPVAINLGSLITFTNSEDLIWNNTNYTFRAQTVPNVDWEIDIYDAYDNFVNYQTGHSTDGNIEWAWDLNDYWGSSRADSDADPFFYPYITITQSSGSSAARGGASPNAGGSSSSRWMPPVAAPYPGVGGWIISYQDRFYLDAGTNYPDGNSYFQPAMNSLAGGPALWQIPVIKFPLKFGDSIYNQTNRNDSWTDLRAWINSPSYRNFYYYGHGSANVIGADVHTFDISNNVTGGKNLPGSKAYLTSQYVRDNLTFNKNAGSRPYRFVFLDGCKTANGDWPDAFGINKATNDLSYYSSASNKRHVRPSAFMGWNVTVGGSKEWGRVDKFFDFRSYWMANWSVNKGYDNDNLDAIVESARSGSGWVSSSQLWDHLRIYGYRTLKFDEYNHKGDWSQ